MIKTIVTAFANFINDSKSIGITLLACTIASLFLANYSATSTWVEHFISYTFDGTSQHHIHIGFLSLPNSYLLIINDFLMAFFFLLAGLEIKRELTQGELSSMQKAILPVAAAIGGMLVPAIFFSFFNKGTNTSSGWGIPMATDIAFTLGVASILGKKVPASLKIFLTALAIIDDLGAIAVIALFYGSKIEVAYLIGTFVCMAVLYGLDKLKIAFGAIQIVIGLLLWYCMFNTGIHATVAGVIFAFLTPVEYIKKLEHALHIPVYFIIIPLFVFANTAILLPANSIQLINTPVSWGIIIGLLVGKPVGICFSCYLLVKQKWASLPNNTSWLQLIGGGILAGIGFTMSIFIATLAYTDITTINTAKMGVLLASILAMIIGYVWLTVFCKPAATATEEDEILVE